MPHRPLLLPIGSVLAAALLLGFAHSAQAGLASSLVRTDTQEDTAPDTIDWDTNVNLFVGNVASDFAQLNANMASITANTAARISNISADRSASTGSETAFVDEITLDAPGLPAGSDLLVTIAWKVSGSSSVTNDSSQFFGAGSSLLLDGPGLQKWQRTILNPGAGTLDPFGTVEFEFPIKAGIPEPENVKLIAAASGEISLLGPIIPPTYDVEAAAQMTVTFCGITGVRTTGGIDIGLWTVTAASELDYGEGTDPPVLTNPVLSISPSENGSGFVRLSWPSSPLETYTIEGTDGVTPWVTDFSGPGEDGPMGVDLPKTDPVRIYKLLNDFTP